MGVCFYILFLLIASPVKKEEACQTTEKQVFIVTMDSSVAEKYEYGHEIELKWSISPSNQQVQKFKIQVFKISRPEHLTFTVKSKVHGVDVPCNNPDASSESCSDYRIPTVLEPGDYEFELQISFSKKAKTKGIQASGTFKVKDPALTITRPENNHEYKIVEDVVELEWSMKYPTEQVGDLKILVWNTKSLGEPPTTFHPLNRGDVSRKLSDLGEGSFKCIIQGVTPPTGGQTMKSREKYFTIA